MGQPSHEDCTDIIHRALDAGINVIDTADVYSGGESEVIVGEAIRGRPDEVVLAMKFGNRMGDDANHRGGSRRWLRRGRGQPCAGCAPIGFDVYQMHRPDPPTDLDETLGTLCDLVRDGKVRSIGTSSFAPDQLFVALTWGSLCSLAGSPGGTGRRTGGPHERPPSSTSRAPRTTRSSTQWRC